jgi:hypothetical protein
MRRFLKLQDKKSAKKEGYLKQKPNFALLFLKDLYKPVQDCLIAYHSGHD